MPQNPTVKQQLKVTRMRSHLGKQVKDFLHAANMFLPTLEEVDLKPLEDELIDIPADESVEPKDLVLSRWRLVLWRGRWWWGYLWSSRDSRLSSPLSVNLGPSLESLRSIERELQKGQANNTLEGLCIGLANKSLLLLTDVNKSTSTKQSTRAWASVRNAQSQILLHAHGYQRAWKALKCIGTPEDLIIYQKLEEKDLVVVKDITSAKRFGQGSDSLAWFWRIGPGEDQLTGEWMEECEWNWHFWDLSVYIDSFSLSG